MALPWTTDQQYLLNVINLYREQMNGKDLKTQKRITKELAEQLHTSNQGLQHRTIQSINERLPYLENLLAGVFEIHNYAAKDQHLYSVKPRTIGDKTPNLCNTRHSFNGDLR
ncbi:hypothetical protein JOC85_001163 [Bacillus mesophilus]|uniref:Uncharacterized protein n=1 Tax=Bacillus mesophilus TaxID=1808955 RepID=A0A6M0Q3Z1_9BACI|nr:hypothetical protein [Bacillus mesophilus]MBM7660396.1 hypothetical protein [Bacillus mesophilus]NEY71105.1 hypothetical protein [Bacillus mesophilus]